MKKQLLSRAMCAALLLCTQSLVAAPPIQLTTDLLEHTDRVWVNGYPSQMTLEEARCAIEPVQVAVIYSRHPLLGWVLQDEGQDVRQSAAELLVATSREELDNQRGDMWSCRLEESDHSIGVRYEGEPLQPGTIYYWKVKVAHNGAEQGWSQVKAFQMADTLCNYRTAVYPLEKADDFPVRVTRSGDGVVVADFGRDAFGQLFLTLESVTPDTITVHVGEALKGDRIDRQPAGTIRAFSRRLALLPGRHTYFIKVKPDRRNTRTEPPLAVLMPSYIGEVFPFRYCELEGYDGKLSPEALRRVSVYYPFNDYGTRFTSSDTVLNRVWKLCRYSVKATSFAGVYVDGDRERIPYEADALLNQLCHYAADREFSLARRSHEYLLEHGTWPTEWILQSVLIAWYDYLYTGDIRSVRAHYQLLKNRTLSVLENEEGLIRVLENPKVDSALYDSIRLPYGQKLADIVDWPRESFTFMPYNISPNVFHCVSLELLSRLAGVMGEQEDSTRYAVAASRTAAAINRHFFDKKQGLYRDGIGTEHVSTYSNMFPLAFGLAPQEARSGMADYVASRGMDCSVYAAQFLLEALYENGKAEQALGLLRSTDLRSWYNMIRSGSTITTEAWDIICKPNQDWNHIWGAVPGNIIPRKLMGIEPLEAGFRRVRIRPQPGSLALASICVPTIRGDVKVAFENGPEAFVLEVEIPANMTGEVLLPIGGAKRFALVQDGKPLKGVKAVAGFVTVSQVGSGRHTFVLKYSN